MPSIGHVSSSLQGLHFSFVPFVYLQHEGMAGVAALMEQSIHPSDSGKASKFIHHPFASWSVGNTNTSICVVVAAVVWLWRQCPHCPPRLCADSIHSSVFLCTNSPRQRVPASNGDKRSGTVISPEPHAWWARLVEGSRLNLIPSECLKYIQCRHRSLRIRLGLMIHFCCVNLLGNGDVAVRLQWRSCLSWWLWVEELTCHHLKFPCTSTGVYWTELVNHLCCAPVSHLFSLSLTKDNTILSQYSSRQLCRRWRESRENVCYWSRLAIIFYQGGPEKTLTKTCLVPKILWIT